MKGQTQAVTAVMLTGIVMGGIGTAYLWGVPMLEKREVEQQITDTEEDVITLKDKIKDLSDKGSGATSSVKIDADSLTLNTEDEYIQVTKQLDQSAEQGFTWSLLKGESFQNLSIGAGDYGIEGDDLSGVVAYQTVAGDSTSEITYRVEFRNLCSENTGELTKVDLKTEGQTRGSGKTTVDLTNNGEQESSTVASSGACEGSTVRTSTLIDVQFE